MPQSETNRVSMYASPEATWGETVGAAALAPKMYELRMTGETVGHEKQTALSETIRTDRQRDFIAEVGASAAGGIDFELAFRDWDLFFEGIMANDSSFIREDTFGVGTIDAAVAANTFDSSVDAVYTGYVVGAEVWVSGFVAQAVDNGRFIITAINNGVGITALTVALTDAQNNALVDETPAGSVTMKTNKFSAADISTTAPDKINAASTDFVADMNLAVGQYVRFAGFSEGANNTVFKILGITAAQLTLDTAVIVTETAATVTMTGKRLSNGIIAKSLLCEKEFADITQFASFPGLRPGEMSLSVESLALVTGSFSMMGKEGLPLGTPVAGVTIPAGSTDSMNATTNVGSIEEDGAPLTTAIRSIELSVNNNLRIKPQIGSKSPVDIGYGFIDVSGSTLVYFEDLVLYNKFIQHTESSLSFRFTDADGNIIHFTLPRLFFTAGNPVASGGNEDVMVPLEFTAIREAASDTTIVLDMVAA